MAFKRSAVRSRLSPPRDLEREFRVFFFFAARPRFQRFHDSTLGNGLHEIVLGAFRGNRWGRGNRDFVVFVGTVAPAGWAESLSRVRVSAAARFALLSASRFPPPSQSADAPCDTVAAPCFCCAGRRLLANLDGGPNSVSAAPAAGSGLTALCLARFCRRQPAQAAQSRTRGRL